jgi:hypothetical protein
MNPFTAHTQQQGVSYVEHWRFAMSIACRLLISVSAFALHAILPFIPIAPRHDLEATTAYLMERNQWIETAKTSSTSMSNQNLALSNQARFDDIAIA